MIEALQFNPFATLLTFDGTCCRQAVPPFQGFLLSFTASLP